MPSSKTYQIRIDEQAKKETFAIFAELGLTPAQAVRMFFAQVRATGSIPFEVTTRYYNAETERFLTLADSQKGYSKPFKSVDDLIADLETE